jgi:hypothetical protein
MSVVMNLVDESSAEARVERVRGVYGRGVLSAEGAGGVVEEVRLRGAVRELHRHSLPSLMSSPPGRACCTRPSLFHSRHRRFPVRAGFALWALSMPWASST